MSTIKDIQKATGLSLSTISKHINGGHVRAENHIAIENAIAKYEFRVNRFARSLKTSRSQTIGVIVPQSDSLYFSRMTSLLERQLRSHGKSALICGSQNDPEIERENIPFLLNERVEGILAMILEPTGIHYQTATNRGVPVVYVDRLPTQPSFSSVSRDFQQSMQLAVHEMLSHGHTRIAHIGGSSYPNNRDTAQSFVDALRSNNLEPVKEYVWLGRCLSTENAMHEAYAAVKELMHQEIPPTGIICSDHSEGIACIFALKEMGIRIPEDVSLICWDQSYFLDMLRPNTTIVQVSLQSIAKSAVDLLIEQIDNPNNGRYDRVVFQPTLISGNSVASPCTN